jgi:hypothetical protein
MVIYLSIIIYLSLIMEDYNPNTLIIILDTYSEFKLQAP